MEAHVAKAKKQIKDDVTKSEKSEQIQQQIEEFLKNGGEIEKIPSGSNSSDYKERAGKPLSLNNFLG